MATGSSGTVLPEQNIVIDYKENDRDDCLHFLTYVDTACANIDQIISPSAKVIFTSSFNAWYLKSSFEINDKKTIIHGFVVNKSYKIKYKGQTFIFAFVESMYSAGSVMLVLHGTFGCYIYSGKFCSYPAILNSPVLRPIMERKAVTRFYMDATYYERPSSFDDCFNIATSVANIIRDTANKKIIIHAEKYLTDPILCLIAQQIETKIFVEFARMEALRYLGYGAYFTRNIESTRVFVAKSFRNDVENSHDAVLIYIIRRSEPCDTFHIHDHQNNCHYFYFYAHSSHTECCRLLSCLKPESIHYLYSGLDRSKIVYNNDLTSKLGSKHLSISGNSVETILSDSHDEDEACPPQLIEYNTEVSLLKRKGNSLPEKNRKKRKILVKQLTFQRNMGLQFNCPNVLNQSETDDNSPPAFNNTQINSNALNQLNNIDNPSPVFDKNQNSPNALSLLKTIDNPFPAIDKNRISPNTKAQLNEETTVSKKNDVQIDQFITPSSTTGNTSLPIITVRKFAQINKTREEIEEDLSGTNIVNNTERITEANRPRIREITPPKVNSHYVRTIRIGGNNNISLEIEDTVDRGKSDSVAVQGDNNVKEPRFVKFSSKEGSELSPKKIRIIQRPKPHSLLYSGPQPISRILPTIIPNKEKTTVISNNFNRINRINLLNNVSLLRDHTYSNTVTINKKSPGKLIMVDKGSKDIVSMDGKTNREIMQQVSSDASVPDNESVSPCRRDAPSLLKSGLTLRSILPNSFVPEGNDKSTNSPVNNGIIVSEESIIVNRKDNGECSRDSLHCEQNKSPNNNITLKDYFENTPTFLNLSNVNNSQTNVERQISQESKKKKSSDLVVSRIENERTVVDADLSKTQDVENNRINKKNNELTVELLVSQNQNTPAVHLNIPAVVERPRIYKTYTNIRKPPTKITYLDSSINSQILASSNLDIDKTTEPNTETEIEESPNTSPENCTDSPKSPLTCVTAMSVQNETNVMKCESVETDKNYFQDFEQIKNCSVSLERFPTDLINNYFFSETHGCYFPGFKGFITSEINRRKYTRKIMDINSFFYKKMT